MYDWNMMYINGLTVVFLCVTVVHKGFVWACKPGLFEEYDRNPVEKLHETTSYYSNTTVSLI